MEEDLRNLLSALTNCELLNVCSIVHFPNSISVCRVTGCHTSIFCHRYEIISCCWRYLPDNRPTFEEILLKLREYWDDARLYVVQT